MLQHNHPARFHTGHKYIKNTHTKKIRTFRPNMVKAPPQGKQKKRKNMRSTLNLNQEMMVHQERQPQTDIGR